MRVLCAAYLILALVLFHTSVSAQPTYSLTGNLSATDCEGFFTDSDAGLNSSDYAHGEDYTFQLCVPNATSIELTFFEFCTETGFDTMTIYDGPDASSPVVLGPFSGQDLPPTVVATSGCLTIHWQSDAAGVSCSGWLAHWETEVQEPEPPSISFDPSSPTCSTDVAIMHFDSPVPCDSVYPEAFILSGGQSISTIAPLNCNGGSGTDFELTFAPGLNTSMTYEVLFVYHYADECGNTFELEATGTLEVNDCPLQVEILIQDTALCQGNCTEVWAEVTGGDPNTYTYNWSNGLPNSPGPHAVCPAQNTTYTLTVSDAGPAASATDQASVTVVAPPVISPIPDVCQNEGPFMLNATPSGGTWSGTHVPDPDPIFRPDSGWGTPWTYYTDLNGCTDSIRSEVYQVWAGFDQASCPGEPPFQLTNAVPTGGTWTGPNTTSDGMFDPIAQGSFNIIYTTPDGCTDEKTVSVSPLTMPADLTVCQSDPEFTLSPEPFGGTWSGTGITNWYWGSFEPSLAGPGIHTLHYSITGCSDSMLITVTEIDAGSNYVICPEEPPVQLIGSPAGGSWNGLGVSSSGLYDPSSVPDLTNDTLTYTVNGCSDTRVVYVQQTAILWSGLQFCIEDEPLTLNWEGIRRYPGGGTWSGPGTDNDGPGHFTPALAGSGTHTLYYEANTCVDSTLLIVHENTMFDTSICATGVPLQLIAQPTGGTWSGPGITDPSGTFDPQVAGIGEHQAYYVSPLGCTDSSMVTVYELEQAQIIGLDNAYCFMDSAIALLGSPLGGAFTGPGIMDTVFDPSAAGPGIHSISYTQGAAGCEVSETRLVSVSEPISTQTLGHGETLCKGDGTTVGVQATGGSGNFFSYQWQPDISFTATQQVYPEQTTTYYVTTSDGCSDPALDSITVFVYQPFSAIVETSDTMCYGSLGYATVRGTPASPNYVYQWHTAPAVYDQTLIANAGQTYQVTVTNLHDGNCTFDTSITIPAFPNVTAYFTPNPNGGCLLESDPVAEFIDLSQGAVSGFWDFGDGTQEPYAFGSYPVHTYSDTGTYSVTLHVENETGTCSDEHTFDVCVQPEFKLWIPNAFTPDGDGLNDRFEIVSSGVIEFELSISSSWGTKIYRMTSIDDPPWDGTYKGNPVQQDRYIYEVIAKGRHLGGIRFYKGSGYIHVIRNNP